jgi:putative tryptophan/tyrosine transport system substrate-binding protein
MFQRLTFVLATLVACLSALPLANPAGAQQPASARHIGVLLVMYSQESKEAQAFRLGIREAGYSEGRDVIVEWRVANGDYRRVPELTADLVRQKVDVIVVDSTVGGLAAKRATSTIPIVLATIADPVGSGLVRSIARPEGNITGLSMMTTDLSAKRLQLMKEVIPGLKHVAVLANPDTPYHSRAVGEIKAVAPSLSLKLSYFSARTPEEIEAALSAVRRVRAQALYVIVDPFFFNHRTALLALAARARVPVLYGERNFAEAGALMSYGPNFGDLFRRAAGYVDKIMKGAHPSDLPIGQPTQFELVVNLQTAKALNFKIPESILLRADEVLQ